MMLEGKKTKTTHPKNIYKTKLSEMSKRIIIKSDKKRSLFSIRRNTRRDKKNPQQLGQLCEEEIRKSSRLWPVQPLCIALAGVFGRGQQLWDGQGSALCWGRCSRPRELCSPRSGHSWRLSSLIGNSEQHSSVSSRVAPRLAAISGIIPEK